MLHCRFDGPTIAVLENGTLKGNKAKPLVCSANGFAVNKPSAKSECEHAASRRLGLSRKLDARGQYQIESRIKKTPAFRAGIFLYADSYP
jgi:hypothetical protein